MSLIRIPINASAIPADERGQQQLRVAAQSGTQTVSEVVNIATGQSTVELELDTQGPVTVAIGPEQTSAADLFRRATLTTTLRPVAVAGGLQYIAQPIVVTLPYWSLWLRWCRTFTITGRVLGPGGDPVPSAQVSAYNVDWFWWWSSTGQVGPTVVTDPNGYFTLDFTWCCGWLPWYWWELRPWRLDPVLVSKIDPILKLVPGLHISPPSPKLGLTFSSPSKVLPPVRIPQVQVIEPNPIPRPVIGPRPIVTAPVLNPTVLTSIREKLLSQLPPIPEFERFCLWPWCPWTPWLECDPNIIFKVTQNCGGTTEIIVDETVWQARPNIPTTLNVTLTANDNACTIPPTSGQPEGACFLFTANCGVNASDIGLTGSGPLAGFASPGAEDQPFTGQINISGQFGFTAADLHYADYYSVQYRAAGTATWYPVPETALQPFNRGYFDATQPYGSQWFYPGFNPQQLAISGSPGQFVTVYQSRQFYELSNPTPPNDWGDVLNGQSWTSNADLTAVIDTLGYFTDGPYEFQIIGYTYQTDGTLVSNNALPGCGDPNAAGVNNNNDFTLYLANPIPTDTYPDTSIDSVVINGSALPACGIATLLPGQPFSLAIHFTASDAEGYLDSYALSLQWGSNDPVSLTSCGCAAGPTPTCNLTCTSGGQIGPCYANAVSSSQGATRPIWNGGSMVWSIPNGQILVDSQSCAYDVILTAYKRNIVNCTDYDVYQVTKYYSFTLLFQFPPAS